MTDLDFGKRGDAFWCYAYGVVYSSVCTSLRPEEIAPEFRRRIGITSTWRLSEDPTFLGGEPNPSTCPDCPDTHKHYLLG